MTVPVQETRFSHTGNGVTVEFAYGCQIQSPSDLVVSLDGTVVTSGFIVNGVGASTGGSVTFTTAPQEGAEVLLERIIKLERITDYQQNGDFLARVVNPDFDRLWMALQQFENTLGLAPGAASRVLKLGAWDTNGSSSYRAQNNRIQDLADPVDLQDAANKRWALTQIANTLVDSDGNPLLQLLAASAGGGMIGFNPAVNYVRGTLGYEASIAPSINSFDGVDPTGAADCADAINAAIIIASTLGFKRLRFSGTYKCLSEITLGNCLAYEADPGTTINFDVPEFGMRIPNAGHDIDISGFTLAGTASRMIGVATSGMCSRIRIHDNDISGATLPGAGYTSGIFLDGATDCWVQRNYLHGNGFGPVPDFCADIALYISGNTRCHITENNCTSTTAGFGIICYDLKHSTVSKNSVSGMVTASSNNNGYGICLYDNWSYTHTESGTVFNTVSDNVVADTGGSGIYIVSASHNTITGNTCKSNALTQADVSLPAGAIVINGLYANSNTVNGNTVLSSGKNGIVLSSASYSTVSGNSVASCLGYGIHLRGVNTVNAITGNSLVANAGNIYGDSAIHSYLTITGNVMNATTGTTSGIQFDTLSHSTVLGNLVASSGGHGIYIAGGIGNTVSSNTAIDNSGSASNTYDGINVGSSETSINDNTSRNSGATGQRYGINNTGGGNSILNNRLSGNVTREINDPYGASKRGNKFSAGLSEGISAPMVAGSITIATPEVRTGDIILLTPTATGGAAGALTARNIINGTSFVIDSSSGTDTRPIAWEIIH